MIISMRFLSHSQLLLNFRDEYENCRIEYATSFQFIQFCDRNYCVNKSGFVRTDGINQIVSDSSAIIQHTEQKKQN